MKNILMNKLNSMLLMNKSKSMFWMNNKGSAAVLVTLIFAALIVIVTTLVAASKIVAGQSYADAALQLAGRSILSEYDNKLFKEYGLIAFKGDERQIEKDIKFYSDASLQKDNNLYIVFQPIQETTSFFDLETEVNANLKEHSIVNLDIFEEQIKTAMIKKGFHLLVDQVSDSDVVIKNMKEGEPEHYRTLRNETVIDSLPSTAYGSFGIGIDFSDIGIPDISEITNWASTKVISSEYIMRFFSHANDGKYPEERFFDNEIEYVLFGEMSDQENYEEAKTAIWWLRLAANNVAILMDKDKQDKITLIAKPFMAAGKVGEIIAIIAATEAWAIAETNNDLKLLEEGENVAFVKSRDQWATYNIDEIIEGYTSDEPERPKVRTGQSYRDYLRLLLYFSDKEKNLVRTMDLIQINMQGTYNEDFLLREYYAGFRFDAKVSGKTFSYMEKY